MTAPKLGDNLYLKAYLCAIMPNEKRPTDAGTCIWNIWNGKEWELKIKDRWEPTFYPMTKKAREWLDRKLEGIAFGEKK